MAAAGEPGALRALARWLGGPPGRQWDAEAVLREAGVAGDSGEPLPHVWPVQPAVQQGQVVPGEWSSGDRPWCIWPTRLFKGTHSDSYRGCWF
jgi:hypothetical protein